MSDFQNLDRFTPIVDPDTGAPTEFLMRMLQDRGGAQSDTELTLEVLRETLNTRQVIAGTGLTGGGPLANDVTLNIDPASEAERVRDVIGAALVAGTNITITVNDPGDTIIIDAAGGGGGGSGWSVKGLWDFAVNGVTAAFDTNVAGCSDVLVFFVGVTMSGTAGWRCVRVSSDGGATFDSVSTNYLDISSAGVATGDGQMFSHATASNAARTASISILGLDAAAPKMYHTVRNATVGMYANPVVVNAIRCLPNTATNFNGGKIYVLGR